MSAIRGLQSYITKTAAARERIDLNQSRSRRAKRRSKPRLLCDFSPVVEWILSAYDAHLVSAGQLSSYSLLYGGDISLYSERIIAFVRALKHVGVAPVFFMEGAPGVNFEHFELELPELRRQHERWLEQCRKVYQVCEGTADLLQVQWQLGVDAKAEIVRCLQSEGVPIRHCAQGTTVEMVEYQRRHRSVLGVLSSNTEFAIAAGSKLFPLSLFDLNDDLGLGSASISPRPDTIACERVDPSTLSQSLSLVDEKVLIDVSILCGNRFTAKLNKSCDVVRSLGVQGSSFEQVAQVVGGLDTEQWQYLSGTLQNDSMYWNAITQSFELYDLPDSWRESSSPVDIVGQKASRFGSCEVLRVERKLYDATLAAVGNGLYWRPAVLEPKILGQPCFADLTLPLRKTVYSLLGSGTVYEFGSTSAMSFDTVVVGGETRSDFCINEMTNTERLVALFRLLTPPYTDGKLATLQVEVCGPVEELEEDLLPVLPDMVLACASLCFMQHVVSEHGYQLEPTDLQALLVTCICCSASTTPIIIPERPPSHTLRVAMHFSHVLQQARLLASTLGVADSLPPPSSVFYPMAFIPHSMATLTHSEPSQNLREAFHNSQLVINKPPIQELLVEITSNWQQPNLCHLLRLFSKAVVCIENISAFLFQGSCLTPPPLSVQLIFEEKVRGEDSDLLEEEVDDEHEILGSPDQLPPETSYFFDALNEEEEEREDVEVDGTGEEGSRERSGSAGGEVSGEENEVDSVDEQDEVDVVSEEVIEPPFELHSQPTSPESEEDTGLQTFPASPSSASSTSSSYSSRLTPSVSASPQPADLPISAHRRKLLELIEENNVVCVEGETGCGKSTRVPQYILEHSLSQSPPQLCRILVTQPRRMAAIKLAERVANERGERVGLTVGYCVGGDRTKLSGAAITYCTTGYLLQTLVHNPDTVSRYTHIILDEVHERSTDADFTLLVVRELLERDGPSVKLIIMSATMQSSLVVKYLQESFENVAGPYFVGVKKYGVDTYFINEISKIPPNQSFWDESQLKAAENLKVLAKHSSAEMSLSVLSARPWVTSYTQEVCTEVIISQAHKGESTLVFLPGYNEIVQYYEHLQLRLKQLGIANHFRVFVLHSQVPLEDQREAFIDPTPSVAHVILATNIAESSITLPKLRVVVNFGIYRRLQYDSKRHISCLVKSWCSRASCEQRAGRAGRVFIGTVVHLFTRKFYTLVLPAYDPPEILTSPIAKLVLQAKEIGKKIGHPRPTDFLSLAITPPHLEQLEAALLDLGRLGAIESSSGEDVDEEAEITFLGRFGLSLPVDLDLSRVVLCGVLFGCATDAVVIAASMSLLQEVFSLPSRVLIKDEGEFRSRLTRSYRNRCALDSDNYSDAVMVVNLFKKWLDYRSRCHKERCSKSSLARRFSSLHACRWERLLQLEAVASEIAQKTLHHLPPNSAAYRELKKLASLGTLRLFSHAESSHSSSADFSIDFCEDVDIIRAMLVASYPNQLLFGVQQCNSLNDREKAESVTLLELMRSARVDVARTLVVTGSKKSNTASVQQLIEAVLPNNFFEVKAFGSIYLVTLNHTFETNPLAALLRNLNIAPLQAATNQLPGAESKIISSTLPLELTVFWQFGERRPQWTAGDVNVNFSRPQHPLATTWFRMTEEKEKVKILSWRNPTGLVCEVDSQRKPLPFLAVVSHLQGSSSRSQVSASHISLLPSLHSSRNALLLALTFQPLSSTVAMQVDYKHHQIVGLNINSFFLSPLPYNYFLNKADLEKMNCLRRSISKAFSSDLTQISGELLSDIPLQLSQLLASGRELREPRAKENSVREWEEIMWTRRKANEVEMSESEEEEEEERELGGRGALESTEVAYEYLPPLQCSMLESSEEVLETSDGDEEEQSEEVASSSDRVTAARSYSDTESESTRRSFKLSPNAPEFVPSASADTELQTAALHSDQGDLPSSDQCSTEPEDAATSAAAPVLPLPAPPLSHLSISQFLNPMLVSSISSLPPDQQKNIWRMLTYVDQSMQRRPPGQSKPPGAADQPPPAARPQTSRKRQHEVYDVGGSGPTHSPPFFTSPHSMPPTYFPVQQSPQQTTSGGSRSPGHLSSPLPSQPTFYQQHCQSSARTKRPQFPYPYTAYPSHFTSLSQPSLPTSLPAVTSAATPGLASARSLSPPPHRYTRPQGLKTRSVPPPCVQFSKYARKPLLVDSLQSTLDLSSRAPGARVRPVAGRYQSRFPSPSSLPPPSLGFFGFPRVSQRTQSLGQLHRPHSSLHDTSSRADSTEDALPPQPSPSHSVFPCSQSQYSIICKGLVSHLVAHLQAHGPSGHAGLLVKSFLQENGLPLALGRPLFHDLPVICRGILSLKRSENEVTVSLPPESHMDRRQPVMGEAEGGEAEREQPAADHTASVAPDGAAVHPPSDGEGTTGGNREGGDTNSIAIEAEESPEQDDGHEVSTQSESECTSNPTEEELVASEPESLPDVEEELVEEEVESSAVEDEDINLLVVGGNQSRGESEDMDITVLAVEEEEEAEGEVGVGEVTEDPAGDMTATVDGLFTESSTNEDSVECSDVAHEVATDSLPASNVTIVEEEFTSLEDLELLAEVKESVSSVPIQEESSVNAPPTTIQEEATPPMTTQEEATPPITTQEEATPPTTTQEEATPPTTTQEEATPPTTVQEEATPPTTTQEEATPPTTVQEEATPPTTTQEEATPPTTVQEEATPPTTTQEEATPPTTVQEEATPPTTTQEEATPPTTVQEEATHPITIQEEATPPTTIQEEATHPTTIQEEATPPTTVQEECTPPTTVQEEATPPTTTQEEATPPTTVQEEATPPTTVQEEATPPMTIQEEATPPTTVQEEATPPTTVQEEATPPTTVQEEATPPTTVQEEATPPTTIQEEATPPTTVQQEATPPTTIQEEATPPTTIQKEATPPTNVQEKSSPVEVSTLLKEPEQWTALGEETKEIIDPQEEVKDFVAVAPIKESIPVTAFEESDLTVVDKFQDTPLIFEEEPKTPFTAPGQIPDVTATLLTLEDHEPISPVTECGGNVTQLEEESALPAAVEESEVRSKVTAPTMMVEESEERSEVTAPSMSVEESEERSEVTAPSMTVQESEERSEVTEEKSAPTVESQGGKSPNERTENKDREVARLATPSTRGLSPLRLTDIQVGFFVACLKLTGGHSHTWKLGYAFREQYQRANFISKLDFKFRCDVFTVEGKGCVHLNEDVELGAVGVSPVQLGLQADKIMREYEDICPVEKKNVGGSSRCSYYFRHGGPPRSRKYSEAEGGREEGYVRRSPRPRTRTRKGRRSAEFCRRRRTLSPHFPQEVKSAKDPGHICHILKFYDNFFATRTEPILYSDLLHEYVTTTHLPSDFYLPSDLLRHHFDVYRDNNKRYIRPLKSTKENFPPDTPGRDTSSKSQGEEADNEAMKQGSTRGKEKPRKSKSSSRLRPTAVASSSKSMSEEEAKSVAKGPVRPVPTSRAEGGDEQTPYDVKSPDQPGHFDHILKFYTNLFAAAGEPLPVKDFSLRYLRTYSMPRGFHIPPHFFHRHFRFFHKTGVRGSLVCPLSWRYGSSLSDEAPVVAGPSGHGGGGGGGVGGGGGADRDAIPQTEVWGEESSEQDAELATETEEGKSKGGGGREKKGQLQSVDGDRDGSILDGGEEEREGVGVKKGGEQLVGSSGGVIKNLPHGGTRPVKIVL